MKLIAFINKLFIIFINYNQFSIDGKFCLQVGHINLICIQSFKQFTLIYIKLNMKLMIAW